MPQRTADKMAIVFRHAMSKGSQIKELLRMRMSVLGQKP
jgi:hypothetical protein